ncbi:FtsX-like permease family protein [Nitrospirillum sp. BR 11752]|uniref:ABC transporter permease n=1 Tax=Nitrospirillum sp. BR 11752 TaxID=3104293 RepID=UPI002EBAD8BD|nr:FtsX-like permease family protein [Nitrospirillum sp. BR 11752]
MITLTELKLAARLARRELRGGIRGFRIFLLCLALGVGAIAAVQSVAGGIQRSLTQDGRAILGGDASVRVLYREATAEQRQWLEGQGTVAVTADMRAMARKAADQPGAEADLGAAGLVELKAVDGRYPLYGRLTLTDGGSDVQARLAARDGVFGALIDDTLATRLALKPGDRLTVGDTTLEVRGIIDHEPDKAGSGSIALGPRLMISADALPATGLVRPGSLVNWSYQLRLPEGTDAAAWAKGVDKTFPDAGWRVRDFQNAAPQLTRFIDRLAQFLTLVGLTALLVGGVGVGNAVRSHMDASVHSIATLKCLGAPARLIFQVYLMQILALAGLGIAGGLMLGAVLPLAAGRALAGLLPITAEIGVYPGRLALAALFGLTTALVFSLWPLGQAQGVPAARLFREGSAGRRGRPPALVLTALAWLAASLGSLAVLTSVDQKLAAFFVVGAGATLLLFLGAGTGITRLARLLPRPRQPALRLALSNLHRPGNLSGMVVLSLGLGLTVLVAVALIEGNFRREVGESLPANAPSFFFVDIQPDQLDQFRQTVLAVPGAHDLETTPSLRGTIVRVEGKPAQEQVHDPDKKWVVNGDRGVTYQASAPAGDKVIAGAWWPADYSGPPKLAISKDIAQAFGIGPGAHMTLSVLGREIEAEVAVVRDLDFTTLGINFTLVMSPGVLEHAPQTHLATVRAPAEAEAALQRAVIQAFPNITAIRVKEALATVSTIIVNIGMAVRVVAAVTLVAGTLVLAGAIAAGHRRRVYDAVVLKVLGAVRATVLRTFLIEYGALGLITAVISGALGTLTAWAVLTKVMNMKWVFLPQTLVLTALISTAITLALGLAATWRALSQPAAPLLREE